MTVTMYSTTTCQYCHAEAEWLEQNKIPFTKIVVDEEGEDKVNELLEKSGGLAVPFTVISGDDGAEDKILGFDRARLSQALGLQAA